MNQWWDSNPDEKFWVEITDRDDLGINVIAPKLAHGGKATPGYQLLNHIKEGDIVLHWWMKPTGDDKQGFHGFSKAKGSIQDGSIPWKPRGRYAVGEQVESKPAHFWELEKFTKFESIISLKDLNERKEEVFKSIIDLEKKYGKPLYLPFCKRENKVAPNQTYFSKLPVEFLEKFDILKKIKFDPCRD